MQSGEDRPREEARVRIRTWNVEKIEGLCSLRLSPYVMSFLYIQPTLSTKLSYCLSLSRRLN